LKKVVRKAGRPKVEIDWDKVGKMLEAGAFATGIAATIGCDEATLYRRCETDNKVSFAAFSQEKKAKGDELLRVKQFQTAMSGNVTMQIWLGKQRLGQVDKSEQTQTIRKVEVQWVDPTNDGDEITDSVH
jgi:hypothetical protein